MASADETRAVRITSQFRERHNMTYELDCSGAPLIVRIFLLDTKPSTTDDEWRVEARVSDAPDAVVATATGSSRALAFERTAQWWRENANSLSLATFDWGAIAKAMTAVRAL